MFNSLPEAHRRAHQDALNATLYGASIAMPRSLTMEEVTQGMKEVKGFVPYNGNPEFILDMMGQRAECGLKGGCYASEREPVKVMWDYREGEAVFRQEFGYAKDQKIGRKLSDSTGTPVGDGWTAPDGDNDKDLEQVDWSRVEDILSQPPIIQVQHTGTSDTCVRFSPPDYKCTTGIGTPIAVSDTYTYDYDIVYYAAKMWDRNEERVFVDPTEAAQYQHEHQVESSGTGKALRSEVLCGAPDLSGRSCYTGVPSLCPPPCLNQQTMVDFMAIDLTAASDRVRFDFGAFNAPPVDLAIAAISFLAANSDVIDWITCRVSTADYEGNQRPPGKWGQQLVDLVTNGKIVFRMLPSPLMGLCNAGPFFTFPGRKPATVHICTDSGTWWSYWNTWLNARDGLSNSPSIDQASILIDFAATVLHELTHACGRALTGRHGDSATDGNSSSHGDCAESYRTENMFRWAMYTRFPEAAASLCTSTKFSISDMWGQNAVIYSNANCWVAP